MLVFTSHGYNGYIFDGDSYTDDIKAPGHKYEIIKGYDATCTKDGKTDGKKCATCDEVAEEQIVIPAKGHAWIIVSAVAPTCESKGNSEGKKCERCGLIESEYKEIAPLGHRFGEMTVVSEPTSASASVLLAVRENNSTAKVLMICFLFCIPLNWLTS